MDTEKIKQLFTELIHEVSKEAAKEGAKIAIQQFQKEHLLPVNEPEEKMYELKEVLTLHLKDNRFKKVSYSWIYERESEGAIKNYGTSRYIKKYKESELLAAMKNKGKRRHDLAA